MTPRMWRRWRPWHVNTMVKVAMIVDVDREVAMEGPVEMAVEMDVKTVHNETACR